MSGTETFILLDPSLNLWVTTTDGIAIDYTSSIEGANELTKDQIKTLVNLHSTLEDCIVFPRELSSQVILEFIKS